MSESIRVVLIDDHPLFREGVAITLAANPTSRLLVRARTWAMLCGWRANCRPI